MSAEKQQLGNRPFVVVEVGNERIKMARVERGRRGATVHDLALVSHDGRAETIVDALRDAAARVRTGDETVLMLLPRQTVNLRILTLPSTDGAEIADMVDLQVGKQTPYSRDEIMSDFSLLGQDAQGYTGVLLGIVQRSAVRRRFVALEEAGLDARRVSVSTEGLLQWYAHNEAVTPPQSGADVMIDVDGGATDFLVLQAGRLVFARSILVGAAEMRADPDIWQARFLQEVERSIGIYRGEQRGDAPARLLLTGAAGALPGLAEGLREQFEVTVEIVAPLQGVRVGSGADEVPPDASLTALVGTALAPDALTLNLMPEPVLLRRDLALKARCMSTLGGLAAAVCFAFVSLVLAVLYFRGEAVAALEQRRDALEQPSEDLDDLRERVRRIDAGLDARLAPVNLLRELHLLIPPQVILKAIEYERPEIAPPGQRADRLSLTGSAESRNAVREFVTKLEESALFELVENPDQNTNRDRVDFRIECRLEL